VCARRTGAQLAFAGQCENIANPSCRAKLHLIISQPTDSSTHFPRFPQGLMGLMSFEP
jgi:hypothetical protein